MPPKLILRLTSILAILAVLVAPFQGLLASAAPPPNSANDLTVRSNKPTDSNWTAPGFQSGASLRQAELDRTLSEFSAATELEAEASNDPAVYIIQFKGAPASLYVGDISGLAATSPLATGAHKLNVTDAAVSAYRAYLAEERGKVFSAIETLVGHSLEVLYTYDLAYHGAAVKLTPAQAAQVANLPGVIRIEREKIYQLDTDVGPQFIGADNIWSGAATGTPTKGEGILVGVIDTGINMDHPSFADIGGDGYNHTNPLGAGNYIGWCAAGNPYTTTVLPCNDKLIGVWGYASNGNDPEDADGHGSHTASTVAGNVIMSATVDGAGAAITRTISGVAPHANIIAYAACCAGSALQAAIEQIITDSVDVVNYSIGPTQGESNPYTDSNMQGFLGATAAGIFVSVSAGNSGPGASTTGNTAPWVQITAASEHNRNIANSLINMTGTLGIPPADILGKGFTGSLGPTQIVYAGAAPYNNALCGPFPPGTFSGQIVVCDRGTFGRVEKSVNVANAGGGGFVLVNTASNAASLSGDAFAVPGVFVSYADGTALKTWLAGGGVYTASIAGYSVNTNSAFADNMASFSSRGPSIFVPDTIVPSLSAPGVDVLAAYADGQVPTDPEFIMISGTSMASPHAAGAAALMRALYPTWTPAEIKSALMMASNTNMRKEDATTAASPFDRGSGRIVVDGAANIGFVLDETAARFAAANPSTGGNPAILNLASVAQDACFGACTWTRVIQSVVTNVVTYTTSFSTSTNLSVTVSPTTIVLNPGETQTITISADTSAITTTDVWNLGDLNFWPAVDTGNLPAQAHFPVAVLLPGASLDSTLYIATPRDSGSGEVHGQVGTAMTATAATLYGVADPATTAGTASGNDDADWDTNPLDPAFGWFLQTGAIPTGLGRLVVSTSDSNVADLDLALLIDLNDNGTFAWPGERVATSAGSSASELVDLINLQAYAGYDYMVAVYNWSGEANATFNVNVWEAVPTSNLTLTNFPASLGVGEMFTPTVLFDHSMLVGQSYYGLINFGSPTTEDAIGSTLVNIDRTASEVVKTVEPTSGLPGTTLTYTIVIANQDPVARNFVITDAIPAGTTYISGSLSGPNAVYDAGTDSILISATLPGFVVGDDYLVDDSLSNPGLLTESPLGGFLDFAAFGAPGARGDNLAFAFNDVGCPTLYTFYGNPAVSGTNAQSLGYSTNGGFFPRSSTTSAVLAGSPLTASLPTAALPNGFLTGFGGDLSITNTVNITDAGRIAIVGGTCGTDYLFGLQLNLHKKSDDSQKVKVQYVYDETQPDEHWLAFGDVSPTFTNTNGISGAEAFDGLTATAYTGPITDGLVLKFYKQVSAPSVTITFQVTVDNGAPDTITNIASYTVDAPNTTTMEAIAVALVPYNKVYLPVFRR